MESIEPWIPALRDVGVIGVALVLGWFAYRLSFRIASRTGRGAGSTTLLGVIDEMRPGARFLFPLIAARIVTPGLEALTADGRVFLERTLVLAAVAAATLLLNGVIGAVAHVVIATHDMDVADNLGARRIHTQVAILERTTKILVVILGLGFGLMTFPSVRQFGTGLLASAGVVGLVVGFAARPVLENLISGLQLALTQPIRIDDVVIVEGEWGRIEEITATYVVVKIWDERRLVVPFATFIQKPFQNWTRQSAEILGTVFLWADYTLPVAEARAAFERIVRECDLWDGRVCNVQVVETTAQAVQLRGLVSASDASRCWDLRVHVRERWLAWLQSQQGDALPRSRVSLTDGSEAPR